MERHISVQILASLTLLLIEYRSLSTLYDIGPISYSLSFYALFAQNQFSETKFFPCKRFIYYCIVIFISIKSVLRVG